MNKFTNQTKTRLSGTILAGAADPSLRAGLTAHLRHPSLWMALALLVLSLALEAGAQQGRKPFSEILQTNCNAAGAIQWPGFKGQRFIAEAQRVSIGVRLAVFNRPLDDYRRLTLHVFDGHDLTASPIASLTVNPPAPPPPPPPPAEQLESVWVGFDLPDVSFKRGRAYTFIVTAESYYWGCFYNQVAYPDGTPLPGAKDYEGGCLVTESGIYPYLDLTFAILPLDRSRGLTSSR